MMSYVIFLIDLNQDVAALRPVARFVRRESSIAVSFVATSQFRKRDIKATWFPELQELARELNAELIEADTVAAAVAYLAGKRGLIFSASESALNAHAFNHAVFLAAPSGFTRVTLQHGLECIGFNHNAAHDRTWRHYVGMACDVAASWFDDGVLHSVRPDQQAKIMTVGPQIGLDEPKSMRSPHFRKRATGAIHGLVCENLHSVRFGDRAKRQFVDILGDFAKQLNLLEGTIELRPHPGGLYTERNKLRLPPNVRFNRLPLYKQSLDKFSFCISGPSSILFDMVWADVPVAVWSSGDPLSDTGIYAKLRHVSDASEWLEFALEATRNPAPFLESQADFVASLKIPSDITTRYRELLRLAA